MAFPPSFPTKVEASGSKISPLVVSGLPDVGTEEPHPGVRQEKFTKPNFFRNVAKTETGSKLHPQGSATQPATFGFAPLASPQGKLPEIPPMENPSQTPGMVEQTRNIFGVYLKPLKPCTGGRFSHLVPPSPVLGAGTNTGSRKTSSMDLFARSLLPCSSVHCEPKRVQYQARQGVMIIYMAA